MDFNQIKDKSISSWFQKLYLRRIVVPLAARFGYREHYAYLEESLKHFPNGSKQVMLAKEAGFVEAKYRTLAFGQMGALLLKA